MFQIPTLSPTKLRDATGWHSYNTSAFPSVLCPVPTSKHAQSQHQLSEDTVFNNLDLDALTWVTT